MIHTLDHSNQKKSIRIGCLGLLTHTKGDYRYQVSSGIISEVKKQGISLVYIAGKELDSPYQYDAYSNIIYDLVSKNSLDGLITMSSPLSNFIGLEKAKPFFKSFHDLPHVSIGLKLEGIPSIVVDNKQGMRDLVEHLIGIHGYRRIAFITGPKGHPEGNERYEAYIDVLRDNGIELDEELVAHGDFFEPSGREAAKALLMNGKTNFAAIIAANDNMAIGAIDELSKQGLDVPNDIAVVGFDDIERGKFQAPPLTTVKQLMIEQGSLAVQLLIDMLHGKEVDREYRIPLKLIIRKSCGCNFKEKNGFKSNFSLNLGSNWDSEVIEQEKKKLLSDLLNVLDLSHNDYRVKWLQDLINAFLTSVINRSSKTFLVTLEELVKKSLLDKLSTIHWRAIIKYFESFFWERFHNLSSDISNWGEKLLQRSMSILFENAFYISSTVIGEREYQLIDQYYKYEEIMSAFTLNQLSTALNHTLPAQGIQACYIALYDGPERPAKWSRLILGYNKTGVLKTSEKGISFPSHMLLPPEIMSSTSPKFLLIESLNFRDEIQLGFILYEVEPLLSYAWVTHHVSTALRGILLLNERDKIIKKMQQINNDLKKFLSIASHDLQEPVRPIVSFLQLLERKYKEKLDSDAHEYISFAVNSANRMGFLVNALREYSSLTLNEQELSLTNFTSVINSVLHSLKDKIQEKQANIIVDKQLPSLVVNKLQMIQLFHHLIDNSLKFHKENPPHISVSATSQPKSFTFIIRDNGIGIDPKYFKKVFNVFQRLYTNEEFAGVGIGLAICKKIVELHEGKIRLESQMGKGTTFYITLPNETHELAQTLQNEV